MTPIRRQLYARFPAILCAFAALIVSVIACAAPKQTGPEATIPRSLLAAGPAPLLTLQQDGLEVTLNWLSLLPGDYNVDGAVSGMDVFPLAARFGQAVAETPGNECIDGNNDQTLNGLDLFTVATHFALSAGGTDCYLDTVEDGAFAGEPLNPEPIPYSGCGEAQDYVHMLDTAERRWFALRTLDVEGASGTLSNVAGSDATGPVDYRAEMRGFVGDLAAWARTRDAGFIVIPQNGVELLTLNGEDDGEPALDYLAAIDGVGQEDMLYGWDDDNQATPSEETDWLVAFLDIAELNGVQALVTDYCWTESKMLDSYTRNEAAGYISFAAPDRGLNQVPDYPASPYSSHSGAVDTLSEARNFLYLIDPGEFADKAELVQQLDATNYDLLLIDLFYDDISLTSTDLAALKTKPGGEDRLVIAYMSIGEAEDYRWYWEPSWLTDPPAWLAEENPDWEGNWKVRYWMSGWQSYIFGSENSYLDRILDAGFDGVYLDIIDAYEYFERQ